VYLIENSSLKNKIEVGKVKFIDKATMAEYGSIPEAILPASNCILFVTPIQTKAGAVTEENFFENGESELMDELEEMGYNELRSLGSKLNKKYDAGIDLSGKRGDILDNIMDFFDDNLDQYNTDNVDSEEVEVTSLKSILMDAIDLIETVIEGLSKVSVNTDIAEGVTFTELQQQAERLRDLLNK
jgi:hypothetical protein